MRVLEDGGLPFLPPTSGLSLRREVAECLFPMPTHAPLHTCPDQVIVRLAPLITAVGSVDEALTEYRLHTANSYATSRVTVTSIDREIEFGQALWKQQHYFLSQISPLATAKLTDPNKTDYISFLQYLRAKLCSDGSAPAWYRKYIATLQRRPATMSTLFWRFSFYLPRFLFECAINLFLGQNVVKRAIAWLKGFA
jgi:hypothetical protein